MDKQELKSPDRYNQYPWFCKKVNCGYKDRCFLAFNRAYQKTREMRFDFNRCNLNCALCWSNNNDKSESVTVSRLLKRIQICLSNNDFYVKNIEIPRKPEHFKIQSLQITGGEPFITKRRFDFIFDFLNRFDDYIKTNREYLNNNILLRKGRFKVKIFTNAITIGKKSIGLDSICNLKKLNNLKTILLLSLKGTSLKEFAGLQRKDTGLFKYQVNAVRDILSISCKDDESLVIQLVLGFYHSCYYNIKTRSIPSKEMFHFNGKDLLSKELRKLIFDFRNDGNRLYVEPIHPPLRNSKKTKCEYEEMNKDWLETGNLIEGNLKSHSKTNVTKTKLNSIFFNYANRS